jgi:hypothetical protein
LPYLQHHEDDCGQAESFALSVGGRSMHTREYLLRLLSRKRTVGQHHEKEEGGHWQASAANSPVVVGLRLGAGTDGMQRAVYTDDTMSHLIIRCHIDYFLLVKIRLDSFIHIYLIYFLSFYIVVGEELMTPVGGTSSSSFIHTIVHEAIRQQRVRAPFPAFDPLFLNASSVEACKEHRYKHMSLVSIQDITRAVLKLLDHTHLLEKTFELFHIQSEAVSWQKILVEVASQSGFPIHEVAGR